MKYCPFCLKTYNDSESNCLDDGVDLIQNVCTNPKCENHNLEEGLPFKTHKCSKCNSLTTRGEYVKKLDELLD